MRRALPDFHRATLEAGFQSASMREELQIRYLLAYQAHWRRAPCAFSFFCPQAEKRRRLNSRMYDYLIVGAGFAGSVLAERLARDAGQRVLLVDRRPHIAGNAY